MTGEVLLAVVAAHRRGQPLHPELTALGARCAGVATTAPEYRLLALPGAGVRRGGIVRVGLGGGAVEVELHHLPVAGLGALVVALPSPLSVGTVLLSDGREVVGLLCESWAATGAQDITAHGSWPAWLGRRDRPAEPAPA